MEEMKISKKEQLENKINMVEEQLKDIERARWSLAEATEIEERGEELADFFRIIYKLQMIIKMRIFLDRHGYLVRSFVTMLNYPKKNWGDILVKRKSGEFVNPEKLAIKHNL